MCMLCYMYVVPCIDIPIFHVLKMSLILVFFYIHKCSMYKLRMKENIIQEL